MAVWTREDSHEATQKRPEQKALIVLQGLKGRPITDLAEQEGVTDAYACRLLPLTCLAPDIVEAILDGRQPKGLRLAEMLGNGPLAWKEQRDVWGFSRKPAP